MVLRCGIDACPYIYICTQLGRLPIEFGSGSFHFFLHGNHMKGVRAQAAKQSRAYPGMILGELTLLRRVRKPAGVYGTIWQVVCSCGRKFNVHEQYLFRANAPRRHCGCKNKSLGTLHKREYHIWKMMNRRCYFPTHVSYPYYGGAGIKVYAEWRDTLADAKGFENWFNYIGPAPSDAHTLDRINPFGDYKPGNIRWATAEQQARNKKANWAQTR